MAIADAAYDANHVCDAVAAKRAGAAIPAANAARFGDNPSRNCRLPLDKHACKTRPLVECCFSKLKQFRRAATRYEKTARSFLGVVSLAATADWIKL